MDVVRSPRWRARWAFLAFIVTVVLTRGVTTVLHLRGAGANGGLVIDGVHIHHMVFGIIILVVLTFDWMLHIGQPTRWDRSVITPILFAVAWTLILDEFALIVNLDDVYWAPEGDLSIYALALFGVSLLIASFVASEEESSIITMDLDEDNGPLAD